MLVVETASAAGARAVVRPAERAVITWSTRAATATIEVVLHTLDGRVSKPLPYAVFEPGARASLDGFDDVARIATDVITASSDIIAIDVRANVALERVAVTVPAHELRTTHARFTGELDVPERSQYLADRPESSGWCAPTAIAMLLQFHGVERDVAEVAAGCYDRAYRGTGNWAFATAYASANGAFGAVAYLRDLASVDALLDAGLPPALSIRWSEGELPGAPLAASAGHLVVVRGRTPNGDVIVNDPAQPRTRHVYPADAFERAWLGHGGVALLVAPVTRVDELVMAANA
jgi:hypothetical protein